MFKVYISGISRANIQLTRSRSFWQYLFMKLAVSYCLVLLFWGLAAGQDSQPTPVPIRGEMVVTATRMETRIGDARQRRGFFEA